MEFGDWIEVEGGSLKEAPRTDGSSILESATVGLYMKYGKQWFCRVKRTFVLKGTKKFKALIETVRCIQTTVTQFVELPASLVKASKVTNLEQIFAARKKITT